MEGEGVTAVGRLRGQRQQNAAEDGFVLPAGHGVEVQARVAVELAPKPAAVRGFQRAGQVDGHAEGRRNGAAGLPVEGEGNGLAGLEGAPGQMVAVQGEGNGPDGRLRILRRRGQRDGHGRGVAQVVNLVRVGQPLADQLRPGKGGGQSGERRPLPRRQEGEQRPPGPLRRGQQQAAKALVSRKAGQQPAIGGGGVLFRGRVVEVERIGRPHLPQVGVHSRGVCGGDGQVALPRFVAHARRPGGRCAGRYVRGRQRARRDDEFVSGDQLQVGPVALHVAGRGVAVMGRPFA